MLLLRLLIFINKLILKLLNMDFDIVFLLVFEHNFTYSSKTFEKFKSIFVRYELKIQVIRNERLNSLNETKFSSMSYNFRTYTVKNA